MRLLPDTNTISYLLRNDRQVRAQFDSALEKPETVFVLSPMVDFELRRYLLLKEASRNLRQYEALVESWMPVSLGESDWRLAASLWAERHRAGEPIEDADLLIAVSALRLNAALVTSNPRHFSNLGLTLVDWRQPIPT